MPVFSIASETLAGLESKSNPIYSRKSALPQNPEKDLFPCLATLIPAADATICSRSTDIKRFYYISSSSAGIN